MQVGKPVTASAPKPVAAALAPAQQPETQTEDVDLSSISMMDLANASMADVAEVRGQTWPAGIFDWQISGTTENPGENNDGVKQFKLEVEMDCINVVGLTQMGADPSTLAGGKFKHRITKNIEKPADLYTFLGMVKAFAKDVGIDGVDTMEYGQLREMMIGKQFRAPVRHKVNQRDRDADPFAELVTKKIQPIT